jgi:S1-C subfamily serine protease
MISRASMISLGRVETVRLILLIAASLVASCAGVMPARIGERREPVNRSDLRRQSPEATEILLLQSNVDCEFSIDDKFLTTGQYDVRVLVTRQSHKVTCKPEGYIAKDVYVQPPFSQTSPIGFTFLPDERPRVGYDVLKRGVVKIIAEKPGNTPETGAGVVVGIDKDIALILTAHHVVNESRRIDVVFIDKQWEKFNGRLFEKYDNDLDLAVITVDLVEGRKVSDVPKFAVGDLSELREGDKVFTIGHPLSSGWDISINTNTIRRLNNEQDFRKFRFTNTGVAPGSSGGPIFNEQGGLIGMVINSRQDYAIAVKIDDALSVLRKEWYIQTPNLTSP